MNDLTELDLLKKNIANIKELKDGFFINGNIVLQPNFTYTKDEYNTNNYFIDIQNFKILNGPARKLAEMVIERMKKV